LFLIDEIVETAPVIAEAVSYLTKKVDSKTRDVKVLQPTIATQTVSINYGHKNEIEINVKITEAACCKFQSEL
jgi:hypothetical protein